MAYADPAEYRAARKRWAEANPEKHKASQAAYDARNQQKKRERENEKNWRFKMWEVARMRKTELWEATSLVTLKQLENPEFIFIYGGKKCYENLRSPLPSF